MNVDLCDKYKRSAKHYYFITGSETKHDDCYHSGFSDYCLHLYCYFHNVSADMSSGLLQVFVELGNLHRTSNYVLYWIHGVACSDSVSHNRVLVLSIPVLLLACSQDWICNLQMIVSLEEYRNTCIWLWLKESEQVTLAWHHGYNTQHDALTPHVTPRLQR